MEMLSKNWWAVVLRGVISVLFGIAILASPGIALRLFVTFFGAYAIIDGIFSSITALQHRDKSNWGWLLLGGILSVIAGIGALLYPGMTTLILLYFIAFQAIATGIAEIVIAWRIREQIQGEWLLALAGVLSVIFGIAIILSPGAGSIALLTVIAGYAILFGILLIIGGLQLRGRQNRAGTTAA